MKNQLNSMGMRTPQEPYPGLRPFLDHEAPLLLGRDDQIVQIVDRLKATHFVAVIGGSGSGKSSIIRAGVVPSLRAFGIYEAGDYWIPVIYTPGTSKPKDTERPGQFLQTPVTRLAWKFANTLAPQSSEAETQALCDEIATVFRQGAKFSRLVRAYHELLPSHGPKSDKARFLFVLDQFEELFHPNNRNTEDARLVIEAVIDHFADPDPRCFVVMTMRSEHLADCAAYLQLPEAINRSFYLVRRLKRPELREVITGPAHVFLRLQQRAGNTQQQEVAFAPEVLRRLIADVECIEDDPDHLPLLQHLLARLWQAAKTREGLGSQQDIPSSIEWRDLARATDPSLQTEPSWWQDNDQANTLRLCLENWAQHTYLQRRPEDRPLVDEVLRHLAFKDPNNGQYFQERVNVDDPKLLHGGMSPRQELLRLLEQGFIDTVNYMFWDDENPALTTLKVSHESFIRGWPHFRQLIDVEAERFDEFVTVLRRCLDWDSKGQRNSLLLEAADLERLDARALTPVFLDSALLDDWFGVLSLSRDGERLARTRPQVAAFVRTSRERQEQLEKLKKEREDRIKEAEEFKRRTTEEQKERERQTEISRLADEAKAKQEEAKSARLDADLARARESASTARDAVVRARLIGSGLLMVIVLAAANFAFTGMVKDPAFESIKLFSQAQTLMKYRPTSNGNPELTAPLKELQALLLSAQHTQKARQAFPISFESPADASNSPRMAGWGYKLKLFFPTQEYGQLVRAASTEGEINTALRGLLTSAIWSTTTAAQGSASPAALATDTCLVPPEVTRTNQSRGQSDSRPPTKAISAEAGSGKPRNEFGIWIRSTEGGQSLFIPKKKSDLEPLRLLQASVVNGACKALRTVAEFPHSPWPMALLIDDRVTRLALAQFGPDARPLTTVFSIEWQWSPSASASLLQITAIRQVTETNSAALAFREMADGTKSVDPMVPDVKVLYTQPSTGGHEVKVAGRVWRILSNRSLSIVDKEWSDHWSPLTKPIPMSNCDALGQQAKGSGPAARTETWVNQDLGTCITIAQAADSNANKAATQAPVNVSVYDIPLSSKPSLKAEPQPDAVQGSASPSADWSFDTQPMGQTNQWWIGKPGTKYEGWLAATPNDKRTAAKASPYSTGALIKLGCDIWQTADPAFKPNDDDVAMKDICPTEAATPKR